MKILFIRHGETAANDNHIYQRPEEPLNKNGQADAQAAATQVSAFAPTHLLSSPLWRAIETASIIGRRVGLQPQTEELFAELRRPLPVVGFHHFGPKSIRYMWRWFADNDRTYWERFNGESRTAFLGRVHRAKVFLESFPPDARVVVVSHSIFINFFVAHICNEKPVSFWRGVLLLLKVLRLDNGKSIEVTYEPNTPPGTCAWSITKPTT